MSTATVELPGWLAAVQRGDTVAIVDAGRELAPLMPPVKKESAAALASDVSWTHFADRPPSSFGNKLMPTAPRRR